MLIIFSYFLNTKITIFLFSFPFLFVAYQGKISNAHNKMYIDTFFRFVFLLELEDNKTHYRITLKEEQQSSLR